MIPITLGVVRSRIRPFRFNEKFLEKRAPDVEKFFILFQMVEMIFCKFGN